MSDGEFASQEGALSPHDMAQAELGGFPVTGSLSEPAAEVLRRMPEEERNSLIDNVQATAADNFDEGVINRMSYLERLRGSRISAVLASMVVTQEPRDQLKFNLGAQFPDRKVVGWMPSLRSRQA